MQRQELKHEHLIIILRGDVYRMLHNIVPAGVKFGVSNIRGSYDLIVDLGDKDIPAYRVKGPEFHKWLKDKNPTYETLLKIFAEKTGTKTIQGKLNL